MMLRVSAQPDPADRIAIVGMGCILPGGIDSPAALWHFLMNRGDAVRQVPADRWNLNAVYDPSPGVAGKCVTSRGAFLDSIADFDPGFFGLSLREAAVMDPQQRLLLEAAWRAIEDAGIPIENLAGSTTGVYIGISHSDYHGIQKFGRRQMDVHTSTGGALSIAAARLSHRFDLRGRALAIDTACSSSLVALDAACSDLQRGESDMALVGGVNVILTPDVTISFSRANMLSPDGRCKAFDARANGYVRGEGVGVVVLKPLARARADGDRIHAVIAATAVNQDGRTSTITVPSVDAQTQMLRDACRKADIDPSSVGYVEAHGTGTAVGDPIEATAIGTVFGAGRPSANPCLIGSIKTNIGHLEPAAGIAGLIKAALCVSRGDIPASLHFENPNPNVDFEKLGIAVMRSATHWPEGTRRTAVVNSFGFGGTNACAILMEAAESDPGRTNTGKGATAPILLPISGASEKSRAAACRSVAKALHSGVPPGDVAGTMAFRRSHLDRRCVVAAQSSGQAIALLEAVACGETPPGVELGRNSGPHRLAFVFTGQGAQWAGMGRALLRDDEVFRAAVDQCDTLFRPLSGWSLLEVLETEKSDAFDSTQLAQPATFAIQVGIVATLAAIGIHPKLVVGHSIGEVAAAYACRALSLEDAVRVVYHRSRLQERARRLGAMAAIGLPADVVRSHVAGTTIEIAAINAPELVTVAGPCLDLERFVAELKRNADGVFCQWLRIDYAFHSSQMDGFKEELRESLNGLQSRAPVVPMISTVTGELVSEQVLDSSYWPRNMRDPVLFQAAMERAIDDGCTAFVEIGPHPALSPSIIACLEKKGRTGVAIPSLRRDRPEQGSLTPVFSELHVNGVDVDWAAMVTPGWRFISLPGATFERVQCWSESEESRHARFDAPVHPLLGMRSSVAELVWQTEIDARSPAFLSDHRVDGSTVFPASGYVELMLAAARETLGPSQWEIERLTFHDALPLNAEESVFIDTAVDPKSGLVQVRTRLRGSSEWLLRATGYIRAWAMTAPTLSEWQPLAEPPLYVDHVRFYRELAREGHDFGAAFQGVETIWGEENEVLGRVTLPECAGPAEPYVLHPALLDCCFQIIRGFQGFQQQQDGSSLALPVSVDRITVFRAPSSTVFARATMVRRTDTEVVADFAIMTDGGAVVASIAGFRCRRIVRHADSISAVKPLLYHETWTERPVVSAAVDASAFCAGHWLIVANRGTLGSHVAKLMEQRGAYCSILDFGMDISHLAARGEPFAGVIYLPPIDHGRLSVNATNLRRTWQAHSSALVTLTGAFAATSQKPRLYIVTVDGSSSTGEPGPGALLSAPLTGFVRSIANEFPELRPTLIDLATGELSAERLVDEIAAAGEETEIVYRRGQRFGVRFGPLMPELLPKRLSIWDHRTRARAFRLAMTSPGIIENLQLFEMVKPEPKAGEVLVEVHGVGLNFRDVMAATGMLPIGAEESQAWQRLGFECAGVVREIGDGVDPKLLGRRVAAVVPGCFASHVCVPLELVFPIPRSMSFAVAAGIPVAYSTARYALTTLARLTASDRVLIHAGAGGVGLAAIGIAQSVGAEILATAGSAEKRTILRARGINHVFDSRTPAFFDDVMAATDKRGVDVVLNSLSGSFLHKSLQLLAPGGRFLEIGKRDVYEDTAIGLRGFRQNISLHVIDLARLAADRPTVLRDEVRTVIAGLSKGELPLLPVTEFTISEAAAAFEYMARARHTGKVVITLKGAAKIARCVKPDFRLSAKAAYLVTGGTSGVGLAAAHWLADCGARHLLVAARSAPKADAARALAALRRRGIDVHVVAADVSLRRDIVRVMKAVAATGLPLRGIIHSAGVIEDGLIGELDPGRVARVFEGKVLGAWHLDAATRSAPLDFFVMLSSVAEAIGSIGQAHYAAANRSLHALACRRKTEGRVALALGLGPVADCGHLASRTKLAQYMVSSGVRPMPVSAVLEMLGMLLQTDATSVCFADIDWAALARGHRSIGQSPRTAALANVSAISIDGTVASQVLAAPAERRLELVASYLKQQIAKILRSDPVAIDVKQSLHEIGLDSLTSFELKNRIESDLAITLSIGRFVQRPSIASIAPAILEQLSSAPAAGVCDTNSRRADIEMSPGQEALWFIDQTFPGSAAYGLTMAVAMRPKLDAAVADAAFAWMVARHEALRTVFDADAYGPVPRLLKADALRIAWHDAETLDDKSLQQSLDQIANRPFLLSSGPLTEAHVFRRTDQDIMILHVHHIVADAASIAIVMEDLFARYFALRSGAPQAAAPYKSDFSSFAAWQRKLVNGPDGDVHRVYWRQVLADAPDKLALRFDRPRVSTPGAGAAFRFHFDHELLKGLKELARSQSTTLFAVLMAGFSVLLHRETGDADIIVGTPAGGRTRPQFERLVGYLVNPVPIRTKIASADTFITLLTQVSSAIRSSLEHQDYPFAAMVRDLGVPREAGTSPLFQVMFSMERTAAVDTHGFAVTLLNTEGQRLAVRDLEFSTVEVQRERAQFDLSFAVEEFDGKIVGVVDYRADFWDSTTIEGMVRRYRAILREFIDTPAGYVVARPAGGGVSSLSGPMLDQCPDVIDAVRAIAVALPNREAVIARDTNLSYRELVDRIDGIASSLIAHGVARGDLVGVCLSRGANLPAALLAVLSAGAAYVPLDPAFPSKRLRHILTDTSPALVIVDTETKHAVPNGVPVLDIKDARLSGSASIRPSDSDSLAYVIHTSGSTGRPSGVEVTRGAVANLMAAMRQTLPLTRDDTFLAITTVSFDIAALELLLPLTIGARVAVDDGAARDGRQLATRLAAGDVTAMQATPATWQMLGDAGWAGDPTLLALCGGEALPADLAHLLQSRTRELWNLYGPTETAIWSTAARVEDPEARSIGRPIANTVCHIVDENLRIVPMGEIGELLIGGAGLARGYCNNPARTAERFIPNPSNRIGAARVFRTGDLARVRHDGTLEFLGRCDRQIKLRGFRIEPDEIEIACRSHPAVRDAAVVLVGDGLADRHLVAFVTQDTAVPALDAASLQQHISNALPPAMVPAVIKTIDALPRLPNGKLDQARLLTAAAVSESPARHKSRPDDEIQARLLAIVSDTLGVASVGVNDDFFLLGGTSLLGMRYVARAGNAFGIDLGALDLMSAPTVLGLAHVVRERMRANAVSPQRRLPPYQASWKPLPLLRAEGLIEDCQGAAIAYLPDDLASKVGIHRFAALKERLVRDVSGASWIGACRTSLGSIALWTLPHSAQELISGSVSAAAAIDRAVAQAQRIGAKSVSLTGILPAITALGGDLRNSNGLTTGHATTACAMVRSIEVALADAGRKLSDETVACVGVGAIGSATLRLLLDKLPIPRRLLLCDVPAKRREVEALASDIAAACSGNVHCIFSPTPRAPDDVYQCSLVIGATSIPNVVQADRLMPGTLLVDDSFPYCFDLATAQTRIRDRGDLLVAAGGHLKLPGDLEWRIALPPYVSGLPGGVLLRELTTQDGTLTGCILSSLLTSEYDAPATIGPTPMTALRTHWDTLKRMGVGASALHCGPVAYQPDWLAAFRGRFGVNNYVL